MMYSKKVRHISGMDATTVTTGFTRDVRSIDLTVLSDEELKYMDFLCDVCVSDA